MTPLRRVAVYCGSSAGVRPEYAAAAAGLGRLLDVAGYFQPLVRFLDQVVAEGFLRRESRVMLIVETDPARLLEQLGGYAPGPAHQRGHGQVR